jgi:hypothetical protein
METLTFFQHQPLKPKSRTIRLLYAVPRSDFLPLEPAVTNQFRLQHASFSPELKYAALSYTWGPPGDTRQIILDGHKFTVRKNLYDFLLRPESRNGVPWWIDAICINQDDVEERNSQVSMMGDIFERAEHVYVWLGNVNISLEKNSLLSLLSTLHQHESSPASLKNWWLDYTGEERVKIREILEKIGRADYWNRVWVIQELWLAKKITILFDAKSTMSPTWLINIWHLIPINDVGLNGARTWSEAEITRQKYMFYLRGIKKSNEDMHGHSNVRSSRFEDFIVQLQESQCSIIHDRIYALLGLIEGGDTFRVDYRDSLPRLLLRVLCFCTRDGSKGTSDSIFMLWKRLMSLLSLEKSQLKSALLRDQSATEDLKHIIELRLIYGGCLVETSDRSLSEKFQLQYECARDGTGYRNILICNCLTDVVTKDVATGDQVYLLEGTEALLIYRKGNELDSDTLRLVATANFEVGDIRECESQYLHIFNGSISSFEPSSGWLPRVRSGRELVLDLTMKDFLWAMTGMIFKITSDRHIDSKEICWDQGDLKGAALLPRDTQKETLCLWHREPFTNSKYSYRWEKSLVTEQSVGTNEKAPSEKKRKRL